MMTSLVAAGCLSALAMTLEAGVACDGDDKAQCQPAAKVVQASEGEWHASKDRQVVLQKLGVSSCSGGEATPAVAIGAVGDDAGEGGCPAQQTASLVLSAIEKIDGCCGAKCEARADLVLAVNAMAKAKPGLVCEQKLAALTGGSCGGDKAKAVAVAAAGSCSGDKGEQAQTIKIVTTGSCSGEKAEAVAAGGTCSGEQAQAIKVVAAGSCDGEKAQAIKVVAAGSCDGEKAQAIKVVAAGSCDGEKAQAIKVVAAGSCDGEKAQAIKVVAAGGEGCCPGDAKAVQAKAGTGECTGAAPARYVAFGCEKTDRVARAAARAYLATMKELKGMTGAEGCAAKAASEVLASVLADMQAEQVAHAEAVDVSVSLGAVGEAAEPAGAGCCPSKK